MAVAHTGHRRLRGWLSTNRIDPGDLRLAGGLMLLLAFIRPWLPLEPGVLCPLRAMTGVPCPMCGMTTSVTAAVHLDLAGAFAANPAGIVAVAVACYLLLWRPRSLIVSGPLLGGALLAMWIFELNRYGFI